MPFGLFFGRLANFVNGELWGAPTDLPWAMRLPARGGARSPRHPSQLYEAALEGVVLFAILWYMFWKTKARYQPGKLVGAFMLVLRAAAASRSSSSASRTSSLDPFRQVTHLHMGQWLSLPMILGGLYLVAHRDQARAMRVEPTAGTASSRVTPLERALSRADRRRRARSTVADYMESAQRALLRDSRSARRATAISPPRPRSARCSAS